MLIDSIFILLLFFMIFQLFKEILDRKKTKLHQTMNLLFKGNLIFLLLISLIDLKGQSVFRPGYVITNKNDTLHGLIDYKNETKSATTCVFKESEASVAKEFKPFTIEGYGFAGNKYYVSKNIKSAGEEIPLFLEYLVNGATDLYFYAKGSDLHYFIEKRNGQMFELKNTQDSVYVNGQLYMHENKRYIGILRYAFADCQKILPAINRATLEQKYLISLVNKYNECTGGDEKSTIYKKQLPFVKLKFAPFVSFEHPQFQFNDSYHDRTISSKSAVSPSFGFQTNAVFPRISDKFSLQASGEYSKNSFYGTGTSPVTEAAEEVFINITGIKGKLGLKYTYPSGKFRPTIMLGGNIIFISGKDGKIIDHAEPTPIFIAEFKDYMIGAEPMTGYSLDIGIDYHSKASIVPYLNIGYDNSGNWNTITPVGSMSESAFHSVINTIRVSIGIYL